MNFTEDAILKIARTSKDLNQEVENIGARRLRAVMSKILEDLSYNAPDKRGEKIEINGDYVHKQLEEVLGTQDLSKYIL